MAKMVYGQNGIGQNGMDKIIWTKWCMDRMVLDKIVWTQLYGQNGIWTEWYCTKWYRQNCMDKWYINRMVLDKMVRTK